MEIKNSKKHQIILILGLIGVFFLIYFPLSAKAAQDNRDVLFISSYSESYESVPQQLKGIQSALEKDVILEIEYMDTKRFDTAENKRLFYEHLSYKLKNLPPYEAIIVGDDNALEFVMAYHDELFPNIPVVFFGINDWERAKKAAALPLFTGMVEKFSMDETIRIAKTFNPDATKVIGIVDATLTGQGDEGQFLMTQSDFPDMSFSVLNASKYRFEELGPILESYEDDVILLFLSVSEDKTGAYLSLNNGYKLLRDHVKIPIYRTSIGGIGDGILGGKLVDYEAFGRISGELVMDVLNGKSMENMELIEDTPYYYIFDYELIKKYDIPEHLIPEDAVLINKEESLLERYWTIFLGIGIIVVFLLIVSLILIADNLKRRKIQKELSESNDKLKSAYAELEKTEDILRQQYEIIQKSSIEVGILNQKYAIATEITNSAVWELDLKTRKVMISDNFSLIIKRFINKQEEILQLLKILKDNQHKKELITEIKDYLKGASQEINIQVPIIDGNNETRWILVRGRGISQGDGEIKQIYGILMDTTKMKEQEDYIAYLATHDFLTQLPNRMSFLEKLQDVLMKGESGAVLLFDIDNFKGINDTQGHVYGDELLKDIALRLQHISNEKLFVSRLGGDEFLVLIENVNRKSEIEQYANRIRNAFEASFVLNGKANFVSISMGITCFPEDSNEINQIIMNADTAMYHVKHNGKNSCAFYHRKMKDVMNEKIEIEMILREALKKNAFKLLYQPQIDLNSGKIHSFEALLRLKDHSLRPDQFIPVAEETNLIISIGRWVAKAAIEQFVDWRNKGLGEKTIAINYSNKQLRDRDFIIYLTQLVKLNNINPELIEIEITESFLLENNSETMAFLHGLKEEGFRIALDDFGTGYSSLNYLTYIPVDKVKLDKTINDKFLNLANNRVMDSLISLAHSLKLEITAEGIEEWDQYLQLKQGGCDYIQGYLFSKPVEADAAEKLFDHPFIMLNE